MLSNDIFDVRLFIIMLNLLKRVLLNILWVDDDLVDAIYEGAVVFKFLIVEDSSKIDI